VEIVRAKPAVSGIHGWRQLSLCEAHNPFAYITDVLNSPSQTNNLVPFTQFTTDLANNQLPNYSFIIPNQQNNAHDCPAAIPNCTNADKLAATDSWLKTNIDPLIASAAFRQGGLLIITFDESIDADTQNGGGHVATVVISSKTPQNFQSSTLLQHQSTLRVMAEALDLTSFPGRQLARQTWLSSLVQQQTPRRKSTFSRLRLVRLRAVRR